MEKTIAVVNFDAKKVRFSYTDVEVEQQHNIAIKFNFDVEILHNL